MDHPFVIMVDENWLVCHVFGDLAILNERPFIFLIAFGLSAVKKESSKKLAD